MAIPLAVVAALPKIVTTPPVLKGIVSAANRRIAPGRIEVSSLRLSWLGTNQVANLALRDRNGKTLLKVSQATFDGGIVGMLSSQHAKLTVEGAVLDIEHRADGTSDLQETLAPLLAQKAARAPEPKQPSSGFLSHFELPKRDLTLAVVNGAIRVKSPELPEPFIARQVQGKIKLAGRGNPTSYQWSFAQPAEGDDAKLEITGELIPSGQEGTPPSVTTILKAERWPWSFGDSTTNYRGRFQGRLFAKRAGGFWTWSGDGRWLDLLVQGTTLGSDRIRLREVSTDYELAETELGWDFRRLNLHSPVGSLKATDPATRADEVGSTRIEGRIDLAALARQLPETLRIREGLAVERGEAQLVIEVDGKTPQDVHHLSIKAALSDLVAQENGRMVEIRKPGSLSAKLYRRAEGFGVEELSVKTAFLEATGGGDFDRGVAIKASLDLERLQQEARALVDLKGIALAGKGQLGATYKHASGQTFAARVSAEFQALKIVGLTDEPLTHDKLRVDFTTKGTTGSGGLPESWSHAQLGVKSDTLTVETSVTSKRSNSSLAINNLRVALQIPSSQPPQPGQKEKRPVMETIRFAVRGRLDLAEGVLDLQPHPSGVRPEPIALAADGLHLVGLGTDEQRMAFHLAADLNRLDRVLAQFRGQAPLGLGGLATLKGGVQRTTAGKLELGANLESSDLSISKSGQKAQRALGHTIVGLQLRRGSDAEPLSLDPLIIAGNCGRLDAQGTIDLEQRLEIRGKLTPSWEAIDGFLAQAFDPKARVRAEPRPLILRAKLNEKDFGETLQTLEADLGFDRLEANILGMHLAPLNFVAHGNSSGVMIEPIETSLNGGALRLKPDVVLDDKGAITVRLGAGSEIREAQINDEVSRGFLAYFAPVLADATHVHGKFSAHFERADFPLNGHDSHAVVVGRMLFDNVVFDAGNLAGEILGLTGRRTTAKVPLNEPIEIRVANGRVYQRGLSVPVGRGAKIVLEGSVGFDSSLALRARLPIPRGIVGDNDELGDLVEGLRVGVPIGGTLSHPQIDRQALRLGLKNVNTNDLKRKASGLLEKLIQPEPEPAPSAQPRQR